jgi:hypothetical protein
LAMIRKAPSPVPFEGGLECRPEDRAAPALVIEPTTQATIFYVVFAAFSSSDTLATHWDADRRR